MADITISKDETLEIDAIIEQSSRVDSVIGVDDRTDYNLDGFQTHTGVFNPQGTGEYNIKVNGQTLTVQVNEANAIPDSVVVNYDATVDYSLLNGGNIVSDGEPIDEWRDKTNNNIHVTGGSPIRKDNIQNGKTVLRFDGNDDILTREGNIGTFTSQPFTAIAVAVSAARNGDEVIIAEGTTGNTIPIRYINDSWNCFAGSNLNGGNTTPPVIISVVVDGANSVIRENGIQQGSGNAGTQSIANYNIGNRDGDSRGYDGDIGEVLLYDEDLSSTGRLTDEEQRLSNKWGISI